IKTNFSGFVVVKAAKSQWSTVQYRFAKLSSGIDIDLTDEQIFLDCNQLVEHEDRAILTAKFYLSGYSSVICPGIAGIKSEYAETEKQNYLFYLPDIREIEQEWANDQIKLLRMEIDLDTIRRFVTELDTVPKQLQKLIEDKNTQRFHFAVGGITSQMQTIIGQICHHPYQGAIAKMYLEGKAWELFALQLAQLSESELSPVKSSLKPQTIDRIYQARDILATRLENPSSILELAQQVGLGESTLRGGFRKLFNTTVISYLTALRMEQAELLLRERKLAIGEVANSVGYSNLSHFSAAFKRHFGITPSQCVAGKKSLQT
ncbi:MAG: AraC family transcriptional regulator, partial [Cyanobacteria bacterium J06638_38]